MECENCGRADGGGVGDACKGCGAVRGPGVAPAPFRHAVWFCADGVWVDYDGRGEAWRFEGEAWQLLNILVANPAMEIDGVRFVVTQSVGGGGQ